MERTSTNNFENFSNYKKKVIEYFSIISIVADYYNQNSLASKRIEKDLLNISNILQNDNITFNYFSNGTISLYLENSEKKHESEIKNKIKNLFDSETADSIVLFLSGSGTENGDFILDTLEGEKYLTYDEIVDFWNTRKNRNKNKYLLINNDSCYSGIWVDKNRAYVNFCEEIGIFIQSSCLSYQKVVDCPDIGGILTYNLSQLNSNIFDRFVNQDIDEYQKPTSSGSYFKILNEFGLKIMLNSWGEFKEMKLFKENYDNGDSYYGELENKIREGLGIYIWENGNKYEGVWLNGNMNGFGREFDKDMKLLYEGEWRNGKYNGIGKRYYDNGDVHEGNFINDKRNGFGVYYWVNQDKFEGEWLEEVRSGYGKFYHFFTELEYEGEWKEDQFHGRGMHYYANGDFYEGEFLNYKKNGYGVYIWSNGEKYEGEWYNDQIKDVENFIE